MITTSPMPQSTSASLAAAQARAQELRLRYDDLDGRELVAVAVEHEFRGRIALVSSFGSEAAVLLHMLAETDPAVPVVFLDTGKLFGETLRYRDALVQRLGLGNVRSVRPDPARLRALDPDGVLWRRDADRCCLLRKVEPLARALEEHDAWITGRKSYQGGQRSGLVPIEAVDGRIKFNPLARWRKADIEAYFEVHDLPRHPLEGDGYFSIGCIPCTDRVAPSQDIRAGRWRGQDKDECGIHLPQIRAQGQRAGANGGREHPPDEG